MPSPRKTLRDHQLQAFRAAVRALDHMPRATVISATGTGKTLTAIHIGEHFAAHGNILVVVPSLNLVSQTATHWHDDSTLPNLLGVCSLPPSHLPQAVRAAMPVTTQAGQVAKLVAANDGPTVAFATYSSLKAIARAHRHYGLPPWSLVVIDEAHRSSGSRNKDWAAVHKDSRIPAQRRLYMTATPRTWHLDNPETSAFRPRRRTKRRRKVPLASMDDPTIFGPVVYQLGLADAIDRGILADYRVVVPVINDDELRPVLQNRRPSPHNDGLRLSALQVCLLRAMAAHKARRVISFHSRIDYAQNFSDTLPATVAAIAPATGINRLWVHALHSKQRPSDRARRLTEFENIPLLRGGNDPHGVDGAVLSNVRVLGEGVDVPDADAVVFADPKRTSSDIIQALGRALRQPPGAGKVAILILPVYVGARQSTENALNSSEFRIVWRVLNGLRVHDARIWHRFGGSQERPEGRDTIPAVLPAPERTDEVAGVTSLRMHQIDTRVWSKGWDAAVRYFERHGHLNVRSAYTDPDGYPLGIWIGRQRSLYAAGTLEPERALALNSLNISWPHPPDSFEHRLGHAATFATLHGTLAVAEIPGAHGSPMIRWLNRQRALADSGRMHPEHQDALSAVDPWWNPPWGITWQHEFTLIRRQLDGHLDDAEPGHRPHHTAYVWLDRQITDQHTLRPQQVALLAELTARHPDSHPHTLLLQPPAGNRMSAFHRGLRAARQFQHREGHLNVAPAHREDLHGRIVRLGIWIAKCRAEAAQLTAAQRAAVTALGVDLPLFQAPPPAPEETLEDDDAWWNPPTDLAHAL
ncbi:Helicase associated domain protein [Streptomyces albidoflavus]|uniref:DEAD/DEAH box helicase n=1 Tax=Streptomyces albidoflavus TaxID=1886 RepID=UPI003444656A